MISPNISKHFALPVDPQTLNAGDGVGGGERGGADVKPPPSLSLSLPPSPSPSLYPSHTHTHSLSLSLAPQPLNTGDGEGGGEDVGLGAAIAESDVYCGENNEFGTVLLDTALIGRAGYDTDYMMIMHENLLNIGYIYAGLENSLSPNYAICQNSY